jgi:hypothetical protein
MATAFEGNMVAHPDIHAWALTYWFPRSYHGLEIAYCCRIELNEFQ